jgi:hypothetical protein
MALLGATFAEVGARIAGEAGVAISWTGSAICAGSLLTCFAAALYRTFSPRDSVYDAALRGEQAPATVAIPGKQVPNEATEPTVPI